MTARSARRDLRPPLQRARRRPARIPDLPDGRPSPGRGHRRRHLRARAETRAAAGVGARGEDVALCDRDEPPARPRAPPRSGVARARARAAGHAGRRTSSMQSATATCCHADADAVGGGARCRRASFRRRPESRRDRRCCSGSARPRSRGALPEPAAAARGGRLTAGEDFVPASQENARLVRLRVDEPVRRPASRGPS